MRALGVLVVTAVLGTASIGHAAPQYVRLSYDSTATHSEMAITWNTVADVATGVQYGLAPGNLTQTVPGTSFRSTGDLGYVHEVRLTGLQPDTTYYYRAGDSSDGFSDEASFTTGPDQDENCGAFRFAYLGDNRPDPTFGGGENYDQILGELLQHNPEFILTGGDMVEEGTDIGQWIDLLGYTADVFNHVPFMPSMGNHDHGPVVGDGAYYNDLFALPRATGTGGSGTEDYYYFTYGNAIFVALSTETYYEGTPKFAEQAAWFDEVLTNNPRRWKIVFYHRPTYTHEVFFGISHPPNESGHNEAFVDIIDKHHVDMVITSHNHWYERYEPTACGKQGNPGSTEPCVVGATNYEEGTVHIVSGGAGAFTIPGGLCGIATGRATCSGAHHYLMFDITNEALTMETWGANPEPQEVIDVITITKPAANCAPVVMTDAGPTGPIDAGAPPPDADPAEPDADPAAPDSSVLPGTPDSGSNPGNSDSGVGPEAPPAAPGVGCCSVASGTGPGGGSILLAMAVGLLLNRRRRH